MHRLRSQLLQQLLAALAALTLRPCLHLGMRLVCGLLLEAVVEHLRRGLDGHYWRPVDVSGRLSCQGHV